MKNLNKILSYIVISLSIVILLSILQLNFKKICADLNTVTEFNEDCILRYSKDYYESKYGKNNMYYIILSCGYEKGHDFCIVRVKSKEDIKESPSKYTCELKVYDDNRVLEN